MMIIILKDMLFWFLHLHLTKLVTSYARRWVMIFRRHGDKWKIYFFKGKIGLYLFVCLCVCLFLYFFLLLLVVMTVVVVVETVVETSTAVVGAAGVVFFYWNGFYEGKRNSHCSRGDIHWSENWYCCSSNRSSSSSSSGGGGSGGCDSWEGGVWSSRCLQMMEWDEVE